MTYACPDCGFVFFRVGEVSQCPACEKRHIRPASEQQIKALAALLDGQAAAAEQ